MSHPLDTTTFWNCTPPRPPVRGTNALTVAQWFGVAPGPWKPYRRRKSNKPKAEAPDLLRFALSTPAPGTITLVTGPSGAGKSTLLREWIRAQSHWRAAVRDAHVEPLVPRRHGVTPSEGLHVNSPELALASEPFILDLASLEFPDVPLVDLFPEISLKQTLALLGRVGLGEVWTYLRTPAELSDGQRWRLKLAAGVYAASARADHANASCVLVCDEFTAVLDRVTAGVVARGLRKLVDQNPTRLSALVATAHDDLQDALRPDTTVVCDFTRVHLRHT